MSYFYYYYMPYNIKGSTNNNTINWFDKSRYFNLVYNIQKK